MVPQQHAKYLLDDQNKVNYASEPVMLQDLGTKILGMCDLSYSVGLLPLEE
jgi:hypothetical protein